MTTQSPVKRHCESCAGWGDCPCGDKNCRWERKNLTTIPTSIKKEIEKEVRRIGGKKQVIQCSVDFLLKHIFSFKHERKK